MEIDATTAERKAGFTRGRYGPAAAAPSLTQAGLRNNGLEDSGAPVHAAEGARKGPIDREAFAAETNLLPRREA